MDLHFTACYSGPCDSPRLPRPPPPTLHIGHRRFSEFEHEIGGRYRDILAWRGDRLRWSSVLSSHAPTLRGRRSSTVVMIMFYRYYRKHGTAKSTHARKADESDSKNNPMLGSREKTVTDPNTPVLASAST